MSKTSVIFDIDGTLIDSTALDDQSYRTAVRRVLGADVFIRPTWGAYEHVTDSGILRELCVDNGIDPMSCATQVRACFGDLVSEHVKSRGACEPIRGAVALLATLASHPGFQVGIATGGWGHTARLKLASAGYLLSNVPLKTADDHHERTRIMDLCKSELGNSDRILYVGDGEWDRKAAARLGWEFVGVGKALQGQCDRWAADFAGDHIRRHLGFA